MHQRTPLAAAVAILLVACAPHPEAAPAPTRSAQCRAQTMIPLAHADTTIYDTLSVTERPRLLHAEFPTYPEDLKRAGIGGEALVEVVIDTVGRAEPWSIRLLSVTHPDLVQPALRAAGGGQWCPGTRDGHWVRVRVAIPIRWSVTRYPSGR